MNICLFTLKLDFNIQVSPLGIKVQKCKRNVVQKKKLPTFLQHFCSSNSSLNLYKQVQLHNNVCKKTMPRKSSGHFFGQTVNVDLGKLILTDFGVRLHQVEKQMDQMDNSAELDVDIVQTKLRVHTVALQV